MQLRGHGGQCCGVMHLYGFQGTTVRQYSSGGKYKSHKAVFKEFIEQFNSKDHDTYGRTNGKRGKLIEVILTDGQVKGAKAWIPLLKEAGFKLVTRFHNSTGGWCNVFHLTTQQCGDETVPEWWQDKAEGE